MLHDKSLKLEIQALFFDALKWSRGSAADWCDDHDHKPVTWRERTDNDGATTHHIAVLFQPDGADPDSFVTLADDFPDGVSATMAKRKAVGPIKAAREIAADETIEKAGTQTDEDPLEFVLSDNSVDRMGDVIEATGWRLAEFKRNPIALFAHDHKSVLGTWEKVRIEGDRLLGRLKLAAPGTSRLVDEVRSLLEQRVLRAVSVGFRPLAYDEIVDKAGNWTGFRFTLQALHEVSVVAVPANANALAVAKALDISPATRRLIFAGNDRAKSGAHDRDSARRGETADNPKPIAQGKKAMDPENENENETVTLSAQIKAKEKSLTRTEVEIENLSAEIIEAGGDASDEQEAKIDALNEQQAKLTKSLGILRKLEQNKAGGGGDAPARGRTGERSDDRSAPSLIRGAAEPKNRKKGDLFIRWVAVNAMALERGWPLDRAAEKLFGQGAPAHEKGMSARILDFQDMATGGVERSSVAPAMTNVTGWAAELVGEEVQGFIESMAPIAALPKLLARSSVISARFGPGVGAVSIPVEGDVERPLPAPPGDPEHVAGEFFGEGDPIRVARFTIEEMNLAAKETGVIVPWTRKLEKYSAIELVGFIENAIRRHTARRLDSILLSAQPMTAIYPQGLADPAIPGFTSTAFAPATPGEPTIAEIEAALGGLIDGLGPNAIDPVLIVPDQVGGRLGRIRMPTGPKAFADDLASGQLMGVDTIGHDTGPTDTIFALDAGRFIAAYGMPDFDISSEATLHMENTAPLPIVDGGGAVAAPTRSLFQTASRAVRMILDTSWAVGGYGRSQQLTGIGLDALRAPAR